jgi:hypothetical protein
MRPGPAGTRMNGDARTGEHQCEPTPLEGRRARRGGPWWLTRHAREPSSLFSRRAALRGRISRGPCLRRRDHAHGVHERFRLRDRVPVRRWPVRPPAGDALPDERDVLRRDLPRPVERSQQLRFLWSRLRRRARVLGRYVPVGVCCGAHAVRPCLHRRVQRCRELRAMRQRVPLVGHMRGRRVRMPSRGSRVRLRLHGSCDGSEPLRSVQHNLHRHDGAVSGGPVRHGVHRALHGVRGRMRRHDGRSAPLWDLQRRVRAERGLRLVFVRVSGWNDRLRRGVLLARLRSAPLRRVR